MLGTGKQPSVGGGIVLRWPHTSRRRQRRVGGGGWRLLGAATLAGALGLLATAMAQAAPLAPHDADPPHGVVRYGDDALPNPEPSGVTPFAAPNPLYLDTSGPGAYDVVVVGVSTASLAAEATSTNSATTISRADAHWNYATRGAYRLDYRAFVPLRFTGDACDLAALTNASAAAVRAATNDLTPRTGRQGVLIVHSLPAASGCAPGQAYLGGITQYVSGYWTQAVGAEAVAHEAGHSFLLDHANALVCPGAQRFSATPSPMAHLPSWPCGVEEYHDVSSIMGLGIIGGGPTLRRVPFNQLQHLGVIDSGALVDFGTGSGAVALHPIDTGATGTRALRLRVPGTSQPSGRVPALASITLEFRRDTNLVAQPGVFVTADAGAETYSRSWAYVGESFWDGDYGLRSHTRIKLADGRRVLVGEIGATAPVTVVAASTAVAPTAPAISSASGATGAAALTYTPPEDDGGAPVTGYQASTDTGATWRACVVTGATSCTVSGLPAGQTSRLILRAVNSAGPSRASTPRDVVIAAAAPSAPRELRSMPGDGSATVTFLAPLSDGGAPITRYEYSIDGGTWTTCAPASPATTCTISGLTNGTKPRVAIRARTASGPAGVASAQVELAPVAVPTGAVFVPLPSPARVADTRTTGSPLGPGPDAGRVFAVATALDGTPVVPPEAVAVAYNITAASPAVGGHLRVMPGNESTTAASALNFRSGESIANASVVAVPNPASVRVENRSSAQVNVVLDITGYFVPAAERAAAGRFTALPEPTRVFDSELPGIPPDVSTLISVAAAANGSGEVVPPGADAIAYTVTVVDPTTGGHLRVIPGDAPLTLTSTINWTRPRERIANSAVVGVDANRHIAIHNGSTAPVRVLVDVAGYFSASGAAFFPISPARAYDSRDDAAGQLAAASSRALAAAAVAGQPTAESFPANAAGIAYNLTVTGSRGIGHFRLFPTRAGGQLPGASVLNWPGDGYTRANAGFVGVSNTRSVTLYNGGGDSDAILDVVGYFK